MKYTFIKQTMMCVIKQLCYYCALLLFSCFWYIFSKQTTFLPVCPALMQERCVSLGHLCKANTCAVLCLPQESLNQKGTKWQHWQQWLQQRWGYHLSTGSGKTSLTKMNVNVSVCVCAQKQQQQQTRLVAAKYLRKQAATAAAHLSSSFLTAKLLLSYRCWRQLRH